MENKIIVFQDRKIRRTWFNGEWWFSVSDVVEALTDSADVKQYIKKMRSRDPELNSYWGTICTPLEMIAKDGKHPFKTCSYHYKISKQRMGRCGWRLA